MPDTPQPARAALTAGEKRLLAAIAATGQAEISPYRDGRKPWKVDRNGPGWKWTTFHGLADRGYLTIRSEFAGGIRVSLTEAGYAACGCAATVSTVTPVNTPDTQPYTKGQKIKVFDPLDEYQPPGGWDGTIVRVGRQLVHIDHLGWPSHRLAESFYKDTQQTTEPLSVRTFKTFDQAQEDDPRRIATEVLSRHLLFNNGMLKLPTEVLQQLAAVLTEFEQGSRPPAEPVAYEPMRED